VISFTDGKANYLRRPPVQGSVYIRKVLVNFCSFSCRMAFLNNTQRQSPRSCKDGIPWKSYSHLQPFRPISVCRPNLWAAVHSPIAPDKTLGYIARNLAHSIQTLALSAATDSLCYVIYGESLAGSPRNRGAGWLASRWRIFDGSSQDCVPVNDAVTPRRASHRPVALRRHVQPFHRPFTSTNCRR